MTVLAIDPAESCGFALGSTERGLIDSGTWFLGPEKRKKKGEAKEPDGKKILRLFARLGETFDRQEHDMVVYETPAFGTYPLALISHAKFIAAIELFCETWEIPYRGYTPTQIKKFACGSGNAKKTDMLRAARLRFLLHKDDATDDEADAVALLHLALTNVA
jgi:Holliday junction resolvasome RuvABC endonuclease subunit